MYAGFAGRTALQHPALKRAQVFTLREQATSRAEATIVLEKALQRSGIKIQFEGNKFALVLPEIAGTASMISFGITSPDSSDNIIPAGSLNVENMPVDQAMQIYALLIGRTVAPNHNPQPG